MATTKQTESKAVGNDLESRIIEAAKSLFIENGYAQTCMSDIAARVGINRPVLHYYFRTKDRMFQAVFGTILQSMVPEIEGIFAQKDMTLGERVRKIVDTYYGLFARNPSLPLFVVGEINRDADHLMDTLTSLPMETYLSKLVAGLREEMAEGRMRKVPLHVVFYTFYGLMVIPFLTKNLYGRIGEDGTSFEESTEQWKQYVVEQMENLLKINS